MERSGLTPEQIISSASRNRPPNLSGSPYTTTSLPRPSGVPVDGLNFSDLDLICPINADEITTRWMNPYISGPAQKIKNYPAAIIAFMSRMLKSYAAAATSGNVIPPFIHPIQLKQQPASSSLTTCLSLVRMCRNPLPGSENATTMILEREMQNITQARGSYDDMSLLAAFQAYLIYALVLFLRINNPPTQYLGQSMINLQELAHMSSRQGLVCAADQRRTRPRWEEWIVAEAKRRTLYLMYLFDSVLSAQEGLPTFLGTELQGLPAPGSKSLWQAQARGDWERAYNVYLAGWTELGLAIDEFWPIPPDFDELATEKRRGRVDHWLEDIDEFGTMLYAAMSCTHGD